MEELLLHKFLGRENLTEHRLDGLVSFDYNKTITFELDWDEVTINARGIVFDEDTGKVVALPFRKFWNMEELQGDDERAKGLVAKIPKRYRPNLTGESMILEKADGSCAIVFYAKGKWRVKTRGSFVSDQAVWASAYLHNFIKTEEMNKDWTYLFEIIYPENRIVVDYGDKEALVLTGIIVTATGEELWYDDMVVEAKKIECEIVKAYTFDKFEDIFNARDALTVNEEGFVITFRNGYKFKLKGEAYCNVHRKMCALTPLHFWRAINVHTFAMPDDFLSELPEEFRDTVDQLKAVTEDVHMNLYTKVLEYAMKVPEYPFDAAGNKARYMYITEHVPKEYVGMVLGCVKGNYNKARESIHRMVRPKNNSFNGVEINDRLKRILNES